MLASAQEAHQAATHEESKSEDKHDTRAIEAAYLAKGQVARIRALETTFQEFQNYMLSAMTPTQKITAGAFVEMQVGHVKQSIFFASTGGGLQVSWNDQRIAIVTSQSPLGQALLDARAGDEVELENSPALKTYRILKVL